MLKAIVFDFDGVIVDSEPIHHRAFGRIAEGFGKEFTYDQYLRTYVGYDDRDAFRVMLGWQLGGSDPAEDQEQVAQLCARKAQIFEAMVEQGVQPLPGALDLIDNAAKEMPIAIASGATRADIDLMLDKLGLVDRFELIVTADIVKRSKPDPESYATAVDGLARRHPQLRLTPDQCLAIEDTAAGIESARNAGLRILGLARVGPPKERAQADRVVRTLEGISLRELHAWFD